MPTRPALALVAIVAAPFAASADVGVRGDTVVARTDGYRPGATSAGPRGLPRRTVTPQVVPASFEPAVTDSGATAEPLLSGVDVLAEAVDSVPDDIAQQGLAEPAPFIASIKPVALAADQPETELEITDSAPQEANPSDDRRIIVGNRESVNSAEAPSGALAGLAQWRPSTETLTATGGGLAVCVGLLVVALCVVRSFLPKSSRPLPRDVVEVLGRTTLGGRRTAQLVRVGAKLVLVSTTPDGAETITEITDPDEVARLVALCDAARGTGAEATFQQLFQQMSSEPAEAGFLGAADRERAAPEPPASLFSDGYDPRSLAAAYANTPGGRDAA